MSLINEKNGREDKRIDRAKTNGTTKYIGNLKIYKYKKFDIPSASFVFAQFIVNLQKYSYLVWGIIIMQMFCLFFAH